jgi:hypothetical protein
MNVPANLAVLEGEDPATARDLPAAEQVRVSLMQITKPVQELLVCMASC